MMSSVRVFESLVPGTVLLWSSDSDMTQKWRHVYHSGSPTPNSGDISKGIYRVIEETVSKVKPQLEGYVQPQQASPHTLSWPVSGCMETLIGCGSVDQHHSGRPTPSISLQWELITKTAGSLF